MSAVDTFSVFTDDGTRAAFYRTDVFEREAIPPEAVQISDEDWQAFLSGGQRWNGSGLEPYEPPQELFVPAIISDRQFAQALAEMGVITKPEALAFVKRGEVPAALQTAIDAIADEEERFAADMEVSGATTFARQHPSTLALARALGWSAAQMDALWTTAAAL